MDIYESMAKFRGMLGQNPIRSISSAYYKWKMLDNPYCCGRVELELKEDVVTGSASITPKKISFLGEVLLGAEIGDTFTHPDYRRLGIFSRVVDRCTQFAVSAGAYIIYGTPNEQSLPGYQKNLSYPPCLYAKVKYMCKYLRVNPLEEAFRRKLGSKYLSAILSRAYFCYLATVSFIQKRNRTLAPLTLDILPTSKFEKEVDGLWGTERKDYVFFTIRDGVYFNWRFFSNPDEYLFLVAKENSACVGYIVLKIAKRGDSCAGSICDFVTYQDRIDVFTHLLNRAESLLYDAGVQSIDLLCSSNSPYFETIYRFGYVIRRDVPVIVYSGTEAGKQIHKTALKWHFTFADADNV